MYRRVCILSEIPEDLQKSLFEFLDGHPSWDQDRVFSAAISLFLLQNGKKDQTTSRIYLDTLFDSVV
ncbi:DUF2811 domain-containing protein [Oscillatoria sp. CS-180]|uniref:DUF2811 domain-containing protein n=1 Tax=Oscillatoria sp. CS-180 TaxID=3021720 RepID=UPI00232FA00F|nr:DUF2811 domain-containing protein [Oscillatoria sp. CS-180]MDB9528063.1 DUF2811 domain-containing protein [Oscillatoria sp. CS-180]